MIHSISYNYRPIDLYDEGTGFYKEQCFEVNLRLVSDSEEEAISVINGVVKELGEKLKVGKKSIEKDSQKPKTHGYRIVSKSTAVFSTSTGIHPEYIFLASDEQPTVKVRYKIDM